MRIAIMADLHINKAVYKTVLDDKEYSSLPFRCADFMRAFEWAVTECIKDSSIDLVVIGGDIYDHYNPSNEIRGFFSNQISRMLLKNIPVIILTGNHDVCQKHSALSDIEELRLKNVRVVSEPTVELFTNKNNETARLLLFPYSLDIERGTKTIKKEFNDFIDKVAAAEKAECASLFFGHFPVCGGIMNRYNIGEDNNIILDHTLTDTTSTLAEDIKQKEYRNINKNDVGFSDLDRLSSVGVSHIFLGDFHEFQFIGTKTCKAWYCGSLEKNSFNEKSHQKSFMVYDNTINDAKLGNCQRVYYPNCRPMIDLFGNNMLTLRDEFSKIDHAKFHGAIVRLNFEGSSEELAEFTVGLEDLKKEITAKVNAIHIYQNIVPSKANNKDISITLANLEQAVQDKGHMDAADVMGVVTEMIAERVADENERKITADLANEVYQKTIKV